MQIVEEILPLNYFNDLIGVMVDCSVVENLFEINEEKFHDFIMKLGLSNNLSNIVNKWLISLFINFTQNNIFIYLRISLIRISQNFFINF